MSVYKQIAEEIGQIVTDKNAAYGSSFAKAGEFLKLLYPHGLSVDEFETALLLVRIFDKQMRLATDGDAFGESPFLDIAGYGVLGVSLWHHRKEAAASQVSLTGAEPEETPPASIERWFNHAEEGRCGRCGLSIATTGYSEKLTIALATGGAWTVTPCSLYCHKLMTKAALLWGRQVLTLDGGRL